MEGEVDCKCACVCVCVWENIVDAVAHCSVHRWMIDVHAGLHFWVDWSHSTWANTRWETVELFTTKTSKSLCTTNTHCRNSNSHTTPIDPLPHLHCLKIYLPAAASRRERWALLVLWSPPTRPPWRLQVSSSTSLSLIHSAAQAICFLYYQPVSLYYAL